MFVYRNRKPASHLSLDGQPRTRNTMMTPATGISSRLDAKIRSEFPMPTDVRTCGHVNTDMLSFGAHDYWLDQDRYLICYS